MPNYYYPDSEQELNEHNDQERALDHYEDQKSIADSVAGIDNIINEAEKDDPEFYSELVETFNNKRMAT